MILDALDTCEIISQRQICKHSGLSLGHVNFVLRSLIDKGMVKTENFLKNPRKNRYLYLLTPKGLEAKSTLAAKFVMSKIGEYNDLRQRLRQKLAAIGEKGLHRIVFVGPEIVSGLLVSLIEEGDLELDLVAQCNDWQGLRRHDPEFFDMAVILDHNSIGVSEIAEATGISRDKLLPLW